MEVVRRDLSQRELKLVEVPARYIIVPDEPPSSVKSVKVLVKKILS